MGNDTFPFHKITNDFLQFTNLSDRKRNYLTALIKSA